MGEGCCSRITRVNSGDRTSLISETDMSSALRDRYSRGIARSWGVLNGV